MYITTTETDAHYPVLSASIRSDGVRYTLAETPPTLGERVALWEDDGGLCLREDEVSSWPYPRIEGSAVVLSRAAPTAEPEEAATEPTTEDDLLATALDHEARIAALELLGGGGED